MTGTEVSALALALVLVTLILNLQGSLPSSVALVVMALAPFAIARVLHEGMKPTRHVPEGLEASG